VISTEYEAVLPWLHALAEPRRLELLDLIIRGHQCNCQLSEVTGMPASLISHHLGVLRASGLVDSERDPNDGRWIYYSVNQRALGEVRDVLGAFLDPGRIRARRLTCGPQMPISPEEIVKEPAP
jgi:ArsR family transcriptional regulator